MLTDGPGFSEGPGYFVRVNPALERLIGAGWTGHKLTTDGMQALAQQSNTIQPGLDDLLARYDQAAQQLLDVALHDGHFNEPRHWPPSQNIGLQGLETRAELITTIHDGMPERRDARLVDAHTRQAQAMPAYLQANRLYLALQRRFVDAQAGNRREFLELYQTEYLQALGRDNPMALDEGEAALVQLRVSRAPLSHAHAVAEKLAPSIPPDDPRWEVTWTCQVDGITYADTLRALLRLIAERVVDLLAAGEHLAVRYNTFSNFVWLGIAVWKPITDADVLLARLGDAVAAADRHRMQQLVLDGKAMLLRFLQAHLEDPAQIKPREFWYGQEYSYLTRDMIDLAQELRARIDSLEPVARRNHCPLPDPPPLLTGRLQGHFLEYPHVGREETLGPWRRRARLLRWVRLMRGIARTKKRLRDRSGPDLLQRSWKLNCDWANRTLEIFGVQVDVTIDPDFAGLAADLQLEKGERPVLFLPTHQSVLDHPVMNHVLQRPELVAAMGWQEPVPCVILARTGLWKPADLRIGPWTLSLLGVSADEADRFLVEIDGHVLMQRTRDTGNPTQTFARKLQERPGVVYGAGTTSAHELQCLPMQHGLFAQLPPDIVIVPMVFRGIHALWPKCPRGNLHINPGRVEAVVCPPMPGETTLLPRKRALRTQLEPATLFQAVHIAHLYNPEYAEYTGHD